MRDLAEQQAGAVLPGEDDDALELLAGVGLALGAQQDLAARVLIEPPGRSREPRRTAATTWSKVSPWRRSDSSGTSIEIS